MKTMILHKWQIIALIEFLLIAFLIFKLKRRTKQLQPDEIEILQSKKSDINMEDLMQNMHLSSALYKVFYLDKKYPMKIIIKITEKPFIVG